MLTNEEILNMKYVKIVRLMLIPIAGWPGEQFGENMLTRKKYLKYYLVVYNTIMTVGVFNYISKFLMTQSFFTAGHSVICASLGILTHIKLCSFHLENYGRTIKTFFTDFHLVNFKDKSKLHMTVYKQIEKISYYTSVFVAISTVMAMISFNMTPMYNNIKNGVFRKERPPNVTIDYIVSYLFFNYNTDDHFYTSTFLICYFNTVMVSLSVAIPDLLFILIVFQIIGHIKVLDKTFQNIPQPKTTRIQCQYKNGNIDVDYAVYGTEENKNIQNFLKECIFHHRTIMSFTNDAASLFGPILGSNYMYQLCNCCILLLELSQGGTDALTQYGTLTFVICYQLIVVSILYEEVHTASSRLKDAVYGMPWESMDMKNQRTVYIILYMIQTPIQVTAFHMVTVGVVTMSKILKSTFSYYAFLRTKKH